MTAKRKTIIPKTAQQVSVTVPYKLRKRMKEFASKYDVNWSEIASDAFRAHINESEEEPKHGKKAG